MATQDRRLRECLGRVKGGACCFASVNGLHVEEPSDMLKDKASEVRARFLGHAVDALGFFLDSGILEMLAAGLCTVCTV